VYPKPNRLGRGTGDEFMTLTILPRRRRIGTKDFDIAKHRVPQRELCPLHIATPDTCSAKDERPLFLLQPRQE
jgi:hypothetical protein